MFGPLMLVIEEIWSKVIEVLRQKRFANHVFKSPNGVQFQKKYSSKYEKQWRLCADTNFQN